MAVDALAKIAIFGAGPIGLEAALYARFLGFDVAVYERGRVASHVLDWGHVRMFSPFGLNRSKLGLAALQAQDPAYRPPEDEALHTGRQWAQQYLIPLSRTDLLADCIRVQTTVVAVAREGALKGDHPAGLRRSASPFRILLRDRDDREQADSCDIAIDTTGVLAKPNWMGQGGVPAIGETGLRDRIDYAIPDVLGTAGSKFADRHTLLVGGGYSAATNAVALAELAARHRRTRVTWITRRPCPSSGPIGRIASDRLPQRDQLARAANRLAAGDSPVTHWRETAIRSVAREADRFIVELDGPHAGRYHFDRIIANVGYRPDNLIYQELQVHECYATGGPIKLAAALLGGQADDCLDQEPHGPETLLHPEPNFYILGSKSYGRNSTFLASIGLQQIREVFSLISGRADLNLYCDATSLAI